MKKLLLLSLFILGSITAGFSQVVEDARPVPHNLTPKNIIYVDNSIIISAVMPGSTFKFGNKTLSPANGRGLLLRYDLNWNLIWVKQFKSNSFSIGSEISEIVADKNNKIIISGSFGSTLAVDSSVVLSNSVPNTSVDFLMKMDLNGRIEWSKNIIVNTGNRRKLNTITPDDNGNLLVSGTFINNIEIEGTTYTNASTVDYFLIKYSSAGTLLWVKYLPRTESALPYINNPSGQNEPLPNYPVLISKAGEIFYSSRSRINNNWDSWTGSSLIKLDAAGNQQWSKFIPGALPRFIAIDKNNNLLLAGSSNDTLQFDNISIPNNSFPGNISFIAKADLNGNWIWAKTISLPDMDNKIVNTYLNNLFVDRNNNYNIIGDYTSGYELKFSPEISIGGFPFLRSDIFGNPWSGYNTFLAQYSSDGTPNWAQSFQGDEEWPRLATSDEFDNHLIIGENNNGNQLVYRHINVGSFTILPKFYGYRYFAKVSTNSNFIKGNVYLDSNNNSVKDSTEKGPENLLIQVAAQNFSQAFQTSNSNGNYTGFVPAGRYTVTIPQAPKYYSVDPGQHIVSFAGSGSTKNSKDFRLIPTPNVKDLAITFTPISIARPGFPLRYRITYKNVGTVALSDSVSLKYDSRLQFDSTTVAFQTHLNNRMQWNFQNLQPFEKRQIDVYFTIPATTPLGYSLTAIAKIGPAPQEIYVHDNADTVKQIVVGSYDPNDKQVNFKNFTTTQLLNSEFLEYTIRFQNTGTDTAFTVMVRDVISNKLDLATLEVLSASHPYTLQLLGKGVVKWQFDNILLPDSNRNEVASHGFIRFKIKPQSTLQPGDTISNTAAIYFDFNEPVITNTAVTRIVRPKPIKGELNLYPNPATESVEVAAILENASAGEIRIFDTLGKLVYQQKITAERELHQTVSIQNLNRGIYVVQVVAGKVNMAKRLVVL